ncbi:hypothetical protein BS17DRAFT_787681 [Gyrodon lividus]|nr:hypothetical protein BS17DRAFT_787681 [Gyrodon lividus]
MTLRKRRKLNCAAVVGVLRVFMYNTRDSWDISTLYHRISWAFSQRGCLVRSIAFTSKDGVAAQETMIRIQKYCSSFLEKKDQLP